MTYRHFNLTSRRASHAQLNGDRARQAGFSLIEAMIALTIFVVIVGIALTFLGNAHKLLETESGGLETQQGARMGTDELARAIQQIGFGIKRLDTANSGSWQRDVIYAGSHGLVYNADMDPARGPLSPATTLTFPDGSTYTGEGTAGTLNGAETYVWTIDANADGTISTADRSGTVSGGFNPAADTANPLDYAVFKRVYGFDGSGYVGALTPIVGGLFTNATATDLYGDGTSPNPLFSYWLTEDLNADSSLDDSECVVTPCPPSVARAPLVYLWGDTNFDGALSDAEKSALRTMPVGSPTWSKNRLASSGNYYSTNLSVAYAIATGGGVLKVSNASNFGTGEHIRIGSGGTAEVFVISSVDTTVTPHQIAVAPNLLYNHAVGEAVTVLPQTFLRAIRAVQINFDAITPKKDIDSTTLTAAAGRVGHVGTRGLEYRVRPFERKVDLVNLTTGALQGGVSASPNCPTTFGATCSGSTISSLDVFVPRTTQIPISFVLKDFDGTPMSGKTVTFTNSNSSLGALSLATVTTDTSGMATVQYMPTGVNGTDTVTASHLCTNGSLVLTTMTASMTVNLYKLELARTGYDCLQTYRTGYAAPSSAFTVKVKNPAGSYVTQFPVSLSLAFDPLTLPDPPNYAKITGQLSIAGSAVGTTNGTTGLFGPYSTDTQVSGTLSADLALTNDLLQNGARLRMTAQVADSSCTRYGTSGQLSGNFYNFTLASVNPSSACTESAPCTIPASTTPNPSVAAHLSLNSTGVQNAPVTFSSDDFLKPSSTAKTILNPTSGWTTDVNGDASVEVYNNNDPAIAPGNPLKTHITATSAGPAGTCANGNIASMSALRPEFDYTGPTATGCDIDLQQGWIIPKPAGTTQQMCLDIKNTGNPGGCSVSVTGARFAIYKKNDNVNLDTIKLQVLKFGDEKSTTGTCSNANEKQLFIKNCNAGQDLVNNTRFDFVNSPTNCYLPPSPPNPIDPQNYFVVDLADFGANVTGLTPKRRFVVTVYYQCAGTCSSAVQSKTFDLQTP